MEPAIKENTGIHMRRETGYLTGLSAELLPKSSGRWKGEKGKLHKKKFHFDWEKKLYERRRSKIR